MPVSRECGLSVQSGTDELDICAHVNFYFIVHVLYVIKFSNYCAFDIFQKVIFCLALYTEEVNLQFFVMF